MYSGLCRYLIYQTAVAAKKLVPCLISDNHFILLPLPPKPAKFVTFNHLLQSLSQPLWVVQEQSELCLPGPSMTERKTPADSLHQQRLSVEIVL